MSKEALPYFSRVMNYLKNKLAVVITLLGSAIWSLTMVRSGLGYSFGLGFWGPNAHDGIWHISLSEGIARASLNLPIFSGESIKNYHIGFDVLLAGLHKLLFIPIPLLYFQILPILFSLLIGMLTYKFVIGWTKNYKSALWSLYFVYFGGNFAFIVSLFRGQGLSGESMFWAQPSTSTLLNPPYALSLVLLLLALIFLSKFAGEKDRKYLILSSFMFGLLAQVKVYAAVLAIFSLFVVAIYRYIVAKKNDFFLVFIFSTLVAVVVTIPFLGSSWPIKFAPFWMIETMFAFTDRLYWPKFYEAMINYKASINLIKGPMAYGFAFFVFVVGNLGIRIVSFADLKLGKRFVKTIEWQELFFWVVIFTGFVLPNVFVQEGTPWNTIQFSYYSVFFASLVAGRVMSKIKLNNAFVVVGVLAISIPTTLSAMKHYVSVFPQATLPAWEASALEFLSKQPTGVVLKTSVYNPQSKKGEAPIPLYLYDSTAYVSAYSKKDAFLEDTVNLDILGVDWRTRLNDLNLFLNDPNSMEGREFLKNNKIKYIYRLKVIDQTGLDEQFLGLTNIFDNPSVTIYEVGVAKW